MKETSLEKRKVVALKDKSQYAMAFGIVALMLYVIGFPIFLLLFFGVLAFFTGKIFSHESRTETRKIFEFYLSANEILRDDERRWYGFEIQEAVGRGENILRSMTAAPPLVHFATGALYQKLGDHTSAAKHLADSVETAAANEMSVVFPPKELREYVRLLRRIERAPAESPLTSAAIRALERKRKNSGQKMLAESRSLMHMLPDVDDNEDPKAIAANIEHANESATLRSIVDEHEPSYNAAYTFTDTSARQTQPTQKPPSEKPNGRKPKDLADRKTISEVLHDIYDKNPQ